MTDLSLADPPLTYLTLDPDPRLAPFVESIWIQDVLATPGRVIGSTRILPAGRSEMVVEYREPFLGLDGDQAESIPTAMLWGQRTRPSTVQATGSAGLVIVVFKPWGAASLLGVVEDLEDYRADLGDLVGRSARDRLEEEVRLATTHSDRIRAVEDFLIGRLIGRLTDRPDPRVIVAVQRLRESRVDDSIDRVATDLGTSRRHLGRLIRGAVGLSPKKLHRILRFQAASRARRLGMSWTEVAYACGYSDQAHLTREVSALSGEVPTDLDRQVHARELCSRYNTDDPSRTCSTLYL